LATSLESRPLRFDFPEPGPIGPGDEGDLPGGELTLAELLRGAGYHAIHIGKWHLGRELGRRPLAQGFHQSLIVSGPTFLRADDPGVVIHDEGIGSRFAGSRDQEYDSGAFNEGDWFRTDGPLTEYLTEQAVAAIAANRSRPFFLLLGHVLPHLPLQAPREDYEALGHIQDEELRVYAAMVRNLDRSVGRIQEALEEFGLADDTILMFTSDHGGSSFAGIEEANAPFRGWKSTFFEGGVRVPLVIRWPRRIPAGQEIMMPVSLMDLLPTLAAACGQDLPAGRVYDGMDLMPFLGGEGREDSYEPERTFFWRQGHYSAIRSGRWKLQCSKRPERTWLFDLESDPSERVNLAEEQSHVVEELLQQLAAFEAESTCTWGNQSFEFPVPIDVPFEVAPRPSDEFVYWPN
jgi:uncharacterized sulfatase